LRKAWERFEDSMNGDPFVVSALINDITFADTLIDTGCLSYGLCDSRFARKHNLPRIPIKPRDITGFDGKASSTVNEVAVISLDLDGYREEQVFMYVTPISDYNMILGMPWITAQDVQINGPRSEMMIGVTNTVVHSKEAFFSRQKEISRTVQVSATSFMMIKKRKNQKAQVFAVSMADINKALRVKQKTDPKTKLPAYFHDLLKAFDQKEADKLPPLRGSGVDHTIKLEEVDGKKVEAPWGPLYNMSRDELLVLRKTLTELLDKGFIRVSNSPAAAPVLFVKKPGGGLRFCVDYRGLNRITRKDRYPLPLIYETLRNISKARWFTKLDVIAAFHKIRIAQGDEWLTAFRTRYGLYEWMVTPFGLANAPSTFQKYINWALRDYLDEFCSAYIDDILIYSSGSLNQHRQHVRKVLQRMIDAGLQLDIDKCEFEVKSTKYLGFIIEAGKGLRMDPEKIKAISDWNSPISVKGVRSFLGFANFYQTFIKSYSDLVPYSQG
jgi:predicted aspartyl protease